MNVRLVSLVLALIALLSTAIGGYFVNQMVKTSALQEAERESFATTAQVRGRVSALISYSQKDARVLASFAEIKGALEKKGERTLSEANRVLDTFAAEVSADVCYLMDRSGITIASSNRNAPVSFVGKNYSFRPYFTEAIQGRASMHIALGVTSGKTGLYCSYPVYLPDSGAPSGVVVVKSDVEHFEKAMESQAGSITLLVDNRGIVFASTRKDWALNLLWRVPPEELSQIEASGQFGKGPWKWTGLEKKGTQQAVDSSGELYLLEETTLRDLPRWRIVHLHSLKALSGKIGDPLVGKTGYVAFLAVVLVGCAIIVLFRMGQHDIRTRNLAEEALRESEERYRTFFDTSRDCVFMTRVDGQFIDFNEVALEIFGYAPGERDELLQTNVAKLYANPEEREAHVALISKQGFSKEYPLDLRKKDGTVIHTLITTVARRNPLGKVIGFQGTVRDITERKKSEDTMRQSEERYRALVENSFDGIFVQKGTKIIFANTCLHEMLGYENGELEGLDHWVVYQPEDQGITRERAQARMRGEDVPSHYEVKLQRKDGSFLYGDINAKAVTVDGEPGIQVWVRDITERKRAEEALKESEKQYRSLFEDSIDGVYSVLRDGKITDANASFCKLFDYTREEMIGKDIRELYLDPADRPRFQKEIEKKGFVKDYEVKFRKRDGTEVDCLVTSAVHFGKDGSNAGYRGIVRDLTSRKELQRQLFQSQKMEAIGTLAGGIAHDFNNLLQVISGYSELLFMNPDMGEKTLAGLNRINQAARNGSELVKGLLALGGRAEYQRKPISVNRQVEQVIQLLSRTIPKIIQIELNLADDLPLIYADPLQIEQILMNLGINARDAMPDGGRLVFEASRVRLDETYCKSHVDVEPGSYVLLSVSDTGRGMDGKTAQRIFEPFFTTKPAELGTGLGLSIVYGIVKQHGGDIRCYSEPGKGTTFKVYFPTIEETAEWSDKVSHEPFPSGGTETILLVDDDESIRSLGKDMLSEMGYTVLTASDGDEALEVFRREGKNISLVILDLVMPEMDGQRCLEEILKIDPTAKVLVASGYSESGLTKKTIETGAKGFVPKPYEVRRLLQTVRDVLDDK